MGEQTDNVNVKERKAKASVEVKTSEQIEDLFSSSSSESDNSSDSDYVPSEMDTSEMDKSISDSETSLFEFDIPDPESSFLDLDLEDGEEYSLGSEDTEGELSIEDTEGEEDGELSIEGEDTEGEDDGDLIEDDGELDEELKEKCRNIILSIFPPQGNNIPRLINPYAANTLTAPTPFEEQNREIRAKLEQKMQELKKYEDSKNPLNLSPIDRVLLMDLEVGTKSVVIDRLKVRSSGEEANKIKQWVEALLKIPFGKYKQLPVNQNSTPEEISNFLVSVKSKLDDVVFGVEEAKREILSFVAKKISNSSSRGGILALKGPKGTAKTRLVRKGIAEALGLPFASINFGGMKDSATLTGHDFTYIGAIYGRIAQIMMTTGCMNPIIYLDEIDKISGEKATEIFGVLTHLLDEEQNSEFEDAYFSGIKLDLSKVFFVLSFNHLENVDYIAADRMRIVEIEAPTVSAKFEIVKTIMIPEVMNQNSNAHLQVGWEDSAIQHIISKSGEEGMRKIREDLKRVAERVNLDFFTKGSCGLGIYEKKILGENNICITVDLVDKILPQKKKEFFPEHMYM